MDIQVSISDNYVERLSKWASVQRTITRAMELLDHPESEPPDYEDVMHCVAELRDIGPAIDHLHQMARNQIWEAQKKEGSNG